MIWKKREKLIVNGSRFGELVRIKVVSALNCFHQSTLSPAHFCSNHFSQREHLQFQLLSCTLNVSLSARCGETSRITFIKFVCPQRNFIISSSKLFTVTLCLFSPRVENSAPVLRNKWWRRSRKFLLNARKIILKGRADVKQWKSGAHRFTAGEECLCSSACVRCVGLVAALIIPTSVKL